MTFAIRPFDRFSDVDADHVSEPFRTARLLMCEAVCCAYRAAYVLLGAFNGRDLRACDEHATEFAFEHRVALPKPLGGPPLAPPVLLPGALVWYQSRPGKLYAGVVDEPLRQLGEAWVANLRDMSDAYAADNRGRRRVVAAYEAAMFPRRAVRSPRAAQMTGVEEIRRAGVVFGRCRELFNTRFGAEDLLKLYRAHQASDWDVLPDRWTERQVVEAIERGRAPTWGEHEEDPTYDD